VWGGAGTDFFSTGGRYSPITDSWTATSTANAPTARGWYTAVWTSTEMIVWGGYGCGGNCNLNTGGRYNPSTDSWTAISVVNAPVVRWNHRALWTGDEMIVWGGTDGTNYLHTGGRYDPSTDSWRATTTVSAPTARGYCTGVWTGSEMIVRGGIDLNGQLNTGGRYCAQSGPTPTATPTASATVTPLLSTTPRATPTPRSRPTAASRPTPP
jgi:N-acetylneuraminic acid mutarotase